MVAVFYQFISRKNCLKALVIHQLAKDSLSWIYMNMGSKVPPNIFGCLRFI